MLENAYRRFIFLNWKKYDGVFSLKNHTPVLIYIKSANELLVDGESKHISLLKSFDIDPQAYLGSKHSVNHVFLSPTSIINFTSKKQSYDDTRRSSRDNELLQRAQNDL